MIHYISHEYGYKKIAEEYKKTDIFMTKINVLYLSYGVNTEADFWYQRTKKGISGMICRLGGDYILSLSDNADLTETGSFLNTLGFRSFLCDERFKIPLEYVLKKSGFVMRLDNKETLSNEKIIRYRDYKQIYRFLKKINSKSIPLPGYPDFVTSLYAKVRTNAAEIRAFLDKEKLIAVCISVLDGKNTVISPIATDKNYRKRGIASALIKSISGNVLLLCYEDNLPVYEKMGFKAVGKWKEIYR